MRKSLFCLFAAGLLVAGVPLFAAIPEQGKPKKIVLLGMDRDHGLGDHEYMAGLKILEECLKQTPGVEVTVIKAEEGKDNKQWVAGWHANLKPLEDADCVVCFCRTAGTYFLQDGERKAKFEEIMKQGAGFVCLHWAVETQKKFGNQFMTYLGGYYEEGYSDNPHNTSTVEQPDPKHPVANGWKPFEARDEFYYKIRLLPEAKSVLTASELIGHAPKGSKKGTKGEVFKGETIGWVYERKDSKGPHGPGRSFGFTGCHFHSNFGIEPFRRMIVNGILWTAGIDVPEGGAPVKLSGPVPKIPDGK